MKKFLLFVVPFLLISCHNSTGSKYIRRDVETISAGQGYSTNWISLNENESAKILLKLDERCGDLWCLNGAVYNFYGSGRIVCNFDLGKCILSAKVSTEGMRTTFRSCEIYSVWKYKTLVSSNKLTNFMLDKTVQCIELWEDEGYRR